ncbi:MAG: amidohydrolase family protein [Candidatus Marinimicrobia bacterium]|nr:amidohydrolase family protein [Candidatus Neomarinimicrobiota bacterium]
MTKKKKLVINAKVLFDGKKRYENRSIIVENDKIIEVREHKKIKADYEGYVTPAFIDAHSHIGLYRDGEPDNEQEGNDITNQFLPFNDPLNSVYFDDKAFKDTVDFGVLYNCIVPGSGNLIAGKAMIIRNFVENRKNALIKDYGYKMALGFNPRSTLDWKGTRPDTRMGIYAMLEDKFDKTIQKKEKAILKKEKALRKLNKKKIDKKQNLTKAEFEIEQKDIVKEYELTFTNEDRALLDILSGEKVAKIHVHKEDDVLYLIKLVKKYGINATAEHTGDVFHKQIFDELAKNNIPIVFGPLGGIGAKIELAHASYKSTKLLMKSKAFYGLMTDHPVIWSPNLRDSLKYFLIHGMKEEEAISIITYKNAKILGIDDILGTIEEGKLASMVVWNKNPLHLGAYPIMVMGEGKILRKN